MALTADETAELASLQAALLALRTGQMVSKLLYNGQETDFSKVDLDDLRTRIGQLQAKQASSTGRTRGAIGFTIGR